MPISDVSVTEELRACSSKAMAGVQPPDLARIEETHTKGISSNLKCEA